MQHLTVLVLAAAWWSLISASTAKATAKDDSVNVEQKADNQEADDQGNDQEVQIDLEAVDEQMPLDYSQQLMQQPYPYQQPAYDPGQGYYQQPAQNVQQQQPAPGDRFLAQAAYQQPMPAQGFAQPQVQTSNPVQGVAQSPVQAASGQQGPPDSKVDSGQQVPSGQGQPVQGLAQSPVQVSGGQQGPPDLTVTIKPADGSGDPAAGAASALQHESKFSLCDIMPPPWNILCYIFEFIFFTWPMYYFWLGLIALAILYRIYLAFKEVLDPIIIAILDAIYLVVWVVVRTCQIIWDCIKRTIYPIKESIVRCTDGVDQYLNPWKQRRPHTHVPGFSY